MAGTPLDIRGRVPGVFTAPARAAVSQGSDETAGRTRMITSGQCPAAGGHRIAAGTSPSKHVTESSGCRSATMAAEGPSRPAVPDSWASPIIDHAAAAVGGHDRLLPADPSATLHAALQLPVRACSG